MLNLGCNCCEKQNLLIKEQAPMGMGARRRGGTCPQPSWNLKKMTSYASLLWNTLKFSLAPSALKIKTLTQSLKCGKSAKNFLLRLWRTEKQSTFLGVVGFAPFRKIFCGRPCPWASARKGAGADTSSHGIWNWWRHTQFPCKTLKFSLAPSALAFNTLEFSLKHLKFAKVSTFCRRCAKNWRFYYSDLQIPFILSKTLLIGKNFPFVNFDAQKLY